MDQPHSPTILTALRYSVSGEIRLRSDDARTSNWHLHQHGGTMGVDPSASDRHHVVLYILNEGHILPPPQFADPLRAQRPGQNPPRHCAIPRMTALAAWTGRDDSATMYTRFFFAHMHNKYFCERQASILLNTYYMSPRMRAIPIPNR